MVIFTPCTQTKQHLVKSSPLDIHIENKIWQVFSSGGMLMWNPVSASSGLSVGQKEQPNFSELLTFPNYTYCNTHTPRKKEKKELENKTLFAFCERITQSKILHLY